MTPCRVADLGLVVADIACYVGYVHHRKSKIGEIGQKP